MGCRHRHAVGAVVVVIDAYGFVGAVSSVCSGVGGVGGGAGAGCVGVRFVNVTAVVGDRCRYAPVVGMRQQGDHHARWIVGWLLGGWVVFMCLCRFSDCGDSVVEYRLCVFTGKCSQAFAFKLVRVFGG